MNGLLIKSIIAADEWTCSYDAENRLTEIEYQDGSIIKFLYDGDGKRVARLNVDNEGTIYIGNYFESEYPYIEDTRPPLYLEPLIPVVSGLCEAETESCAYLPVLAREAELRPFPVKRGTSYYYADGQRIAMRTGSETYLLFGDHLASSILLVRGEGTVAEKAYYLPWGGTRGDETITSTAYAYTGQMREGDIYYYGARWPKVPEAKPKGFDPQLGRFMQADTIVPLQVGSAAYFIYTHHSGLINHNYIPALMCQKIGKWKPLIGLVQEQEKTATCTSTVSQQKKVRTPLIKTSRRVSPGLFPSLILVGFYVMVIRQSFWDCHCRLGWLHRSMPAEPGSPYR